MRMPLFSALTLLALLAAGGAALAQEEVDKSKAATFDNRLFAGPLKPKMTHACFLRAYDAEHHERHPKQKVSAMKLLVTAENVPGEKTNYSFRLGVKYRQRPGNFDSMGSCSHIIAENTEGEIRLGCGVACDGGGIEAAISKDDKSAIIRLESVRIWQNNKPDDEAEHALVAGADDKMFRLDRADVRECASLVTDRKELAALRRK